MKIYALICHKLDLTQFWPEVVSWRFEITTDEISLTHHFVFESDNLLLIKCEINQTFFGRRINEFSDVRQ